MNKEHLVLASSIKADLEALANPEKATVLQRFFKTGPGEYGEGDLFWGIPVPYLHDIVKQYRGTPLEEAVELLEDPVHEVRMTGALLMVDFYKKATVQGKEACYKTYLKHATCFNNWDLVDLSCPRIVGAWLWDKDRKPLYELAKSGNLWKERISMISSFYFIREKDFSDSLNLACLLLNHPHDLIQKAVGWMLREVGKRDHETETSFLLDNERYLQMPRTMLRYAIEKFPDDEKQFFMKK
ncbi:MAG: DNA alkylation repair protein [Bacteroidota bacterium]|nr:DNA alkylation repair protein [Bacteroidota bacterium]